MEDSKVVAKQHSEERPGNESVDARRDWVKPSVKRLALKDALNSNSNFSCDGTASQCAHGQSHRS